MSRPAVTKTTLLHKGDPQQVNEQMMTLICRRLYNEAKGLGWGGQVHFITTSSHEEVKVEVEYEDNVGFHVTYYRDMFHRCIKELTPYFIK